MGIYAWVMAKGYDFAIHKTEQRCLDHWRRDLLARASGHILEIGAGTGLNLPHYPAGLSKLTLSEPDPHMRKQLLNKISGTSQQPVQVNDWHAEQIDLPDNSVDTIVSTLVLCSVNCVQQTLQELSRVLRPGGQLLFLEHVRAAEEKIIRWQKRCEPLWRCCCGNCHLTRDTIYSIEETGMVIEEIKEDDIVGAPAIVRRSLRGHARKPEHNNTPQEERNQ